VITKAIATDIATRRADPSGIALPPGRLPATVYLLAAAVFCLGTSEFMIAGLLPEMAADLHASVPATGMLITAFAVGMMAGGPLMAVATLRFPPKSTLLLVGGVFAVAHLLPFVTADYPMVLASRVVAAVACAAFWAVGSVLAVRSSPSGRTARAMAVLVGGLTVANVIGVPAGSWIGQAFGWRAAFLAVALAAAASLALIAAKVPVGPARRSRQPRGRLRAEVRSLRSGRLWIALATTALFQAAVFCAFSYLAPLLTEVAGLPDGAVPTVLLIFGLGSLLGVAVGGRFADRNMLGNVFLSLAAMGLALVLVGVLAGAGWAVAAAVFVFGAASFSIAAALNGRVFLFAGSAPTLAAGINVSAFNLGNAIGPWAGGLVIGAGLGFRAPIWLAIGLTALAVGMASLSWLVERRPARDHANGTETVTRSDRVERDRPQDSGLPEPAPSCPAI
jgi:DHA1 family chloramphenicol resistance protein-like MFS transporter